MLFSDPTLPSVASLVAGAPIRGSWWGDPAGHRIYHVGELLEDHPDVLTLPLLMAKTTLVHRRAWPEVLAVSRSRAPWQLVGLSPIGRALLRSVEAAGEVRLDGVMVPPMAARRVIGDVARDLERRLLVHGSSVHSETGRHVKRLTSWRSWMASHAAKDGLPAPADARARLESMVAGLFPDRSLRLALPWESRAARREPGRGRPGA